ncbi:MAG: type II toxin-antitoxin system VapC family toxin [Planctomycetes bacterium]|nr:type II toxin-antitoxin system VapC family toxin [Planctomycetota bacterium]
MILLDTDHLTVLKYLDSDRCRALSARLAEAKDDRIGTTIVNVEEQMRGWLGTIAREKHVERQVSAYQALFDLFDYFSRFSIGLFDSTAADRFRDLRTSRVRIGTMDLKIAAVALANDALLLTANRSDFEQVPGLRFENWLS